MSFCQFMRLTALIASASNATPAANYHREKKGYTRPAPQPSTHQRPESPNLSVQVCWVAMTQPDHRVSPMFTSMLTPATRAPPRHFLLSLFTWRAKYVIGEELLKQKCSSQAAEITRWLHMVDINIPAVS